MKEKVKRFVESGLEGEEISSPMEPPQAYHLSNLEKYNYADLDQSLQNLRDDHEKFLQHLDRFESALVNFKNNNWVMDEKISKTFRDFFHYFDQEVTSHNAKEEKALFPILHKKLVAVGECSPGEFPTTAVDVMEDDHVKVMQSSCLVFHLLGIGSRLKDAESRNTVFQIAFDQGREIVETMRLHIFKENEVLFPLAQKHISENEFGFIYQKMKPYLSE